jgi:hypothetical protein
MNDKRSLFFAVFLALSPGVCSAAPEVVLDMLGNIYPVDQFPEKCADLLKGAKCEEKAFGQFHVTSKKEGDLVSSTSVFTAPEGVQVTELSSERGGHVIKAMIENQAIKKRSELEVKEGKVFYKVTDLVTGAVKTSQDDAETNLVVPSTVFSYISPFFNDLREGKEVKLKVAVLDRRESFSFVMKKIKVEKGLAGDDLMVLEMEPVSFIVKALVDPMYFYVHAKSGALHAFEGRSALRRKTGDQYKEMKVRTAYEYKVNRYQANEVVQNCEKCEVKTQ